MYHIIKYLDGIQKHNKKINSSKYNSAIKYPYIYYVNEQDKIILVTQINEGNKIRLIF